MKIVISPAKSLDFSSVISEKTSTENFFKEEMFFINEELKQYSPKDLSQIMGISDKLAELNWQRNQAFSKEFTKENSRQAVFAFSGDVYEGLDVKSLDNQEIKKLQNTLFILSGLYGILKPLDLIQPYRLEMGTKIKLGNHPHLYDFWGDKITDFLNENLQKDELFINLASNEYFSVINPKKLKTKIITPIFKDYKGDDLKIISFYAKKARGLMVRYLVKNQIDSIDDLKLFNYEGYNFSLQHSNLEKNEIVFIR